MLALGGGLSRTLPYFFCLGKKRIKEKVKFDAKRPPPPRQLYMREVKEKRIFLGWENPFFVSFVYFF